MIRIIWYDSNVMALADNRKALFDYEVIKRFTAGLELVGTEVKAIREGKINLRGAFVAVRGGEAFLVGADIPAYQPKNAPPEYDATRARKLLLSREEIEELAEAEAQKGLTIVPLSVYNKGRFLKADIAIARGKKLFDKRQAIKKRDVERDLKRSL
jgi:SsrA-binding protein